MIENTRPEPFLIAENQAIDLLNSICAPAHDEIDWLEGGDDLLEWLTKAELISIEDAQLLRKKFTETELTQAADKAKELREYFRLFIKKYNGKQITQSAIADLALVNQILSQDHQYRQVDYQPELGIYTQTKRHWSSPSALLQPLAEAIAQCISESNFSRIKNCENPNCTLWFLDTSKNGRRRWCSMAVCGNRAKAEAYRARQKAQS